MKKMDSYFIFPRSLISLSLSFSFLFSQIVFESTIVSTSLDNPEAVHAVDIDQDGDIDILSSSMDDDKIAWYENNGLQVFTQHIVSTDYESYSLYLYLHLDLNR